MFVTCQRFKRQTCGMMMSVSMCLPVLHHQPVEGEVGYFSFFAGFFHCREQFLSSRHDALRVVLVHEDATGPDVRAARSTTSRSLNYVNLTMTVRSRCWSVAAPVRCALSTRIAATCSTGSFSCSCRALRSASSVSAHVSPGRSFIPSTRRLLRRDWFSM